MKTSQHRAEEINKLILDIASGDFDGNIEISDAPDEWDSVKLSVHLLADELKYTTIRKDQLQMIYNGIVDMLFILNQDRKIRQVNKITLSRLGYAESDLIGKNIFELVEEIDSEVIHRIIHTMSERGYTYVDELVIRGKNNKLLAVSCSFSVLKDKNDNVNGIIIIAKDISQIKKYQQELLIRNKDLDQLFYQISHDFKSPLTNITGFAKLAMNEYKDPTLNTYFDMIVDSVHKLENILNKIREIIETNTRLYDQKKIEELDLERIIFNSYDAFLKRFSLDEQAITLKVSIENKSTINSSFSYVSRIFQNLFDLTYHLSTKKEHTTIFIFIKYEAENSYITYIDNSEGIDPNVNQDAFNMFVKPNVNYTSSGLELYAVREITEKLDGMIELLESSVKGLNLMITLPQ